MATKSSTHFKLFARSFLEGPQIVGAKGKVPRFEVQVDDATGLGPQTRSLRPSLRAQEDRGGAEYIECFEGGLVPLLLDVVSFGADPHLFELLIE